MDFMILIIGGVFCLVAGTISLAEEEFGTLAKVGLVTFVVAAALLWGLWSMPLQTTETTLILDTWPGTERSGEIKFDRPLTSSVKPGWTETPSSAHTANTRMNSLLWKNNGPK